MPDTHSIARSEQLNELATALAAAQAEIVGAKRDSENPFFKAHYADLASVWDACRKPLTAHGLAVAQLPETWPGTIGVTTVLMHSGGQWIASTIHVAVKEATPQAVGSAISYLRRYALAAIVGVAQIDDDGAEATRPTNGHGNGHAAHVPTPAPAPRPVEVPKPSPAPAPTRESDSISDAFGPDGSVTITRLSRKESKPDAQRPWQAAFVTLSDGREAGTFDTAIIAELEAAYAAKAILDVDTEPSRKDASKLVVVSVQLAHQAPALTADDMVF